jgi:hypothetical protein
VRQIVERLANAQHVTTAEDMAKAITLSLSGSQKGR